MKSSFQFAANVTVLSLAASASLGVAGEPSPPPPNAKVEAAADENRTIPRSIFTVPTNPKEGRNPFFPKSGGSSAASTHPTPPSSAIILNGLGGTPDNRLAIINNRTFAEGEEAEVSTAAGRVRIRCIEIKTGFVVIEVAGERRELRLRSEN
jgi:hypothetical protein